MKESDNIELRSEKVRNIIGQIPPIIMRFGITIIFFIIIALLIGSYFFKYQYTIKSTAVIQKQGNALIVKIKTPANEISKVMTGQTVILDFNNIPNLYNQQLETRIQAIPNKLEISQNEGYYLLKIKLSGNTKTETGKEIDIIKPTQINAEIIVGKISFFDKIIAPFKRLDKHKK